ncbi:unnamed protein product [Adineta ricciae]|uniref:ATP-dependent DNA helicase n=1 Tax=Adineta ricciae TaxID=249248 RepID=A0A815RHV4_ADIRI|nr:unnamed protein product [Adineta ricciae]
MRPAGKDDEKYHDCSAGDVICSFCYEFSPKADVHFCPRSRMRNRLEATAIPTCLKLGFLEQRAVSMMHCYVSILIVRGHQSAMKGQVVHCQADIVENIGDLLPFPKCYEFMAVIQQKPTDHRGEIKSTVRYSVSGIQILNALRYLVQNHSGYRNKQVLPLDKIEEMFQCREDQIAPIRIIDSYAYNNCTMAAPIILDANDNFPGPSRTLKPADEPVWKIQPAIGKAIRGTAAYWRVPRKFLRAMYATLGKPNIFLSINLQDDVEFLTHIDSARFGQIDRPNYDAIDHLSDDEYLQLVNENSALVARMCHRRMLAFEKFISDKKYPFFIEYVVTNYFFKVEFQRGGLPHLHTLLWLDNFPSVETAEGRKQIIEFIDKFLDTSLPDRHTDPVGHALVLRNQFHHHTFTCSTGPLYVRIRRGRKFKDEDQSKTLNASRIKDVNKNYLHENEIYEEVDPGKDPDVLQLAIDRKDFFERLDCRFGSPCALANETHFRTHKEARILVRGDRDIIIKRLTEESRRIIPYNLHLLKTFRCNHDIQVITDPWASAEFLFSYVSKNAHMEKDLVSQMSNCTCTSVKEAKAVLLKTGNAVLSHRQVGKVEASWTVLGIPLYHSSVRCKSLCISLPWNEERLLKRGRTEVNSIDDLVESLTHRYIRRPSTPTALDQMTLFEFLTWFDYDRSSSVIEAQILATPLIENTLRRTDFNQPPLLKTSTLLPRIILSCGTVLIQHKEPTCVSFTCRYNESMLAMYSILTIGVPYRDPIEQFLGENDMTAIHEVLLKNRNQLTTSFSRLPSAYKVQMMNAFEHLCDLTAHDFAIKPRTSLIFTTEDDDEMYDEIKQSVQPVTIVVDNIDEKVELKEIGDCQRTREEKLSDIILNEYGRLDSPCTRTNELLASANTQQRFLANFFRQYLFALLRYEESRHQDKHASKPLPFHIVVNGLAGSGKSYVISIIEQMLTDFCISESAMRNRPRKRKGLLKMAHTGKAALNILGYTIHSALGMRPDNTSTPNNAPSFKIHSLRNQLGDLILIIIDEISLVSHNLFHKVNKRLNEIFELSNKSDVYFGNIPVLLFGDLAQCEPVAAKQIFWHPAGETFSLWSDLFRPINFNVNMRQDEDREFFDILCRIRLGQYNEEDENKIKSRSIRKENNPEHYNERLTELNSVDFANAVYAYSVRSKTNERNAMKLKETASKMKTTIWLIQAVDKVGMAQTSCFAPVKSIKKECKIVLKPSSNENECGSMFEQLPLCVGARVICRRNIDFDGTMVNGTEATIRDIVWNDNDNIVLPMNNRCVFPTLDRSVRTTLPNYVELTLDNGCVYKMVPEEVSFKDKNGIWMTRRQLPLTLGYAITVHRTQCMTCNKLVVDLNGINWKPGMFYTILSRTRRLSDIIILDYDRKSFKASKTALCEMSRLEQLEKDYPIRIEQYLGSDRYVEWCLPHSFKVDESLTTSCGDSNNAVEDYDERKRCKYDSTNLSTSGLNKKPEDIIVCERQEALFCGRHALRALAQRLDLFDDGYLMEVARNLVAEENIVRHEQTVRSNDYYYEDRGQYDIQILKAALMNTFNIDLLQLHTLEPNVSSPHNVILSHMQNVQALLIQQDYHYYCLRRFRLTPSYFFKIDSQQPEYHQRIHSVNMTDYLKRLIEYRCNVYVVVQDCSDGLEYELSEDNIRARLWAFPDAAADCECLLVCDEME